jgi:hypothetical protein
VTFRVAGRIVDQVRITGGHAKAASYAERFNTAVKLNKVNPTDALPDAWR